jgi:hypothetical protein
MALKISEANLKMAYDLYRTRSKRLDEIAEEFGCLAESLRSRFRKNGWPMLYEVMGWKPRGVRVGTNASPPRDKSGQTLPGEHPYVPVTWGGPCIVCDKRCGK